MKRFLFLMLLCSPLLFTSCEGDNYYQGAFVDTYYIDVLPRQWAPLGTPGQPGFIQEAEYSVNYITDDVIEYGTVIVYLIDPNEDGDIQLPYVLTREDAGTVFIEMLSYQVYPGGIKFIIDNSDYFADGYDYAIQFKVVVIR